MKYAAWSFLLIIVPDDASGEIGSVWGYSGELRLLCDMKVTERFSIFNFALLCHNILQNVPILICCH